MTPERRLDRLERVAKLFVRAGQRARTNIREQYEKINILIDMQNRSEDRFRETFVRIEDRFVRLEDRFVRIEDGFARTEQSIDRLMATQRRTDEKIQALIDELRS